MSVNAIMNQNHLCRPSKCVYTHMEFDSSFCALHCTFKNKDVLAVSVKIKKIQLKYMLIGYTGLLGG